MFKNHGLSSCTLLTNELNLTTGHWEQQWPHGTYQVATFNFFKKLNWATTALESGKTEQNAHFAWYFKGSKYSQESKIISLPHKNVRLIGANNCFKNEKRWLLKTCISPLSLRLQSHLPPLNVSAPVPFKWKLLRSLINTRFNVLPRLKLNCKL